MDFRLPVEAWIFGAGPQTAGETGADLIWYELLLAWPGPSSRPFDRCLCFRLSSREVDSISKMLFTLWVVAELEASVAPKIAI
jgi:hypothetical protein